MMEKKTSKKSKAAGSGKLLVILLSVILAMLIGLVGVLHWLEAGQTPQPTETTPSATGEPTGILSVPEEWAEYLKLEQKAGDENHLCCYFLSEGRNPLPLFDILFDDPDSHVVGYLIKEDGSRVSVSVVMHEPELGDDWTEEEKELVSAAREAVNEIIGQLDLIDKNIVDSAQKEDIQIQTPYCTVYYPGIWTDSARFEENREDGYGLKLMAVLENGKEIPLAELYFGKGGGFGVWSMQQENGESIDVGLELFDLEPDDTWTEEDRQKVFSMYEDINYLLGSLPIVEKIPDETETTTPEQTEPQTTVTEPVPTEPEETEPVVTQPTQPTSSEGQLSEITISTPVALLYYPAQWEPYLQVETETGDSCTATFYGKVGSHAREHLFTITMDAKPGAFLGTIVGLDGNEYNVYVYFAEFDPDESWTDEDRDLIISMQEDINYLLERLLG